MVKNDADFFISKKLKTFGPKAFKFRTVLVWLFLKRYFVSYEQDKLTIFQKRS